ncbi:MAG: hypothetical protein K2F83_04045 [Oscillospiraceae bacterium]|nr:hypothetical protein [Oscillospiraceae bacterium]
MSNSIFTSMKEQMTPSVEARAALTVKMARTAPASKTNHWGRYAAVAACAALLIVAYPVYQSFTSQESKLHDYTVVQGSGVETVKTMAETVTGTEDEGGDRDQAMTPGELVEAMEEVGFSTGDIDTYQALGYQMTWAKWWKYVGQQRDSEGEEPFILDTLEAFSREELSVNTGDLPSEPVIDVPVQPGADAYQLLMDYFDGAKPDWYGGAYVDKNGALMVLLVTDKDPGDKSLELEVLDAVGKDAHVGFTGAKYSRDDLERMNQEIGKLLDGKGAYASWGIYDDQNRIILDLSETPTDELLAGLTRLDPDGDAILVRVVEGGTTVTDEMVKGPAPVDTIGEEDSGIDVVHHMPGGALASDEGEEDLLAIEPYDDGDKIADLQTKEPAIEEPAEEKTQPARTENAD